MALARKQRFTEKSNDINRYVGRRRQDVFAVGKDGQRLNISGTDQWSGGVGPVTNNEIFGGESMGADWTVATSDSGVLVVGSRQAILAVGHMGDDHPHISALHSGSGTQDVDGNLTCVIWAKLGAGNLTVDLIEIGFAEADGGGDRAIWQNRGGTDWEPHIENDADTSGNDYEVLYEAWTKFKIVIKSGATDFYINDVLKETLTNANNNPDDSAMSAWLRFDGSANDGQQKELRVKRVWVQYGSS